MVSSHVLLDRAKLLCRAMTLAYRICGKNSTHYDIPILYFLHKASLWIETLEFTEEDLIGKWS